MEPKHLVPRFWDDYGVSFSLSISAAALLFLLFYLVQMLCNRDAVTYFVVLKSEARACSGSSKYNTVNFIQSEASIWLNLDPKHLVPRFWDDGRGEF